MQTNDVLKNTLEDRGDQYGDFGHMADLAQSLECLMVNGAKNAGVLLDPTKRECLGMIATKLARIVTGNPNNRDSWLDIAGYATLAHDRIKDPVVIRNVSTQG